MYGRSTVYTAIKYGSYSALQLLRRHGANLETSDVYNQPSLHRAVQTGLFKTIRLLCLAGAQDNNPRALAQRAIRTENPHILEHLLASHYLSANHLPRASQEMPPAIQKIITTEREKMAKQRARNKEA